MLVGMKMWIKTYFFSLQILAVNNISFENIDHAYVSSEFANYSIWKRFSICMLELCFYICLHFVTNTFFIKTMMLSAIVFLYGLSGVHVSGDSFTLISESVHKWLPSLWNVTKCNIKVIRIILLQLTGCQNIEDHNRCSDDSAVFPLW